MSPPSPPSASDPGLAWEDDLSGCTLLLAQKQHEQIPGSSQESSKLLHAGLSKSLGSLCRMNNTKENELEAASG